MTDRWKQILLKYKEWFVFTMVLCLVFCMFLWLSDIGSFYAILPSVILAAVILYVFMGLWLDRRDRKKEKDFMRFLEKPGSSPNEIELLSMNDREIQAMGHIGAVSYTHLPGIGRCQHKKSRCQLYSCETSPVIPVPLIL